MKPFQQKLILLAVGAALLALGAAGGGWWSRQHAAMPAKASAQVSERAPEQGKVLYWYDPMYPQQKFDQPGKSPFMDMQLVPKYADAGGASAGVRIDPAVAQNLGVRLAKVTRIPLATRINASGLIGYDERDVAVVQARSNGFVEHAWPLAPGDTLRAGQPLVELLLPEWAAAQHELLAIRAAHDAALLAAARDRLRLLGMPESLIREVEQSGTPRSRFTVVAPRGGLLQSLEVRPGMSVMAGQTLARINGLSTVWLEVAVPQAYAAAVRSGGSAQVVLDGFPGAPIEGRIGAILPMLNDSSRSLRVRVELPNRDGRLRPGLSAQVSLGIADQGTALALPTEAIIRTGKRALVMLAGEAGHYQPVVVGLGPEIGEQTVITSGLNEGQQVVASGQFLIDSEASLSGIMAREAEGKAAQPALHEADATVQAIGADNITLEHGPFKTLAMPAMTMAYPLAKPDLRQGLKVGDRVRVDVRQSDSGLIVERIEKIGGGQ